MRLKRSLKVVALVLAVLLFFPSAALAALPNNTIIFGTKAYDLSLLNDASLVNEILAAFVANWNSFAYKMPAGNFIDPNAQAVDPATLPAISYMDANKVVTDYRAGDGDVIVPLSVYLASTASGIGKVATLTTDGYPTALQYRLLKADGTALTQKVNVGSSVVVMFLNPGDTCKVELHDAAGTLLDTQTVTTQTGSAPALSPVFLRVTGYRPWLTLNIGQTWQITASTTPSDAVVSYVSSDEAKVTVSSAGVIRAVAPGIATVTISASKAGFIAGVCCIEVTVTAPAAAVSLSNTSSGIGKVATVTLVGYTGAAQYKLLKADGTPLTGLVDLGSTATVMFLNPGDQCTVQVFGLGGLLLGTETVTTVATVTISSVSATNGTVTVTLGHALARSQVIGPFAVTLGDFAVTEVIDGGTATAVTPLGGTWPAGTGMPDSPPLYDGTDAANSVVTLTVPTVAAGEAQQSVVISVSYRGGAAVPATAFTVAALERTGISAISATPPTMTLTVGQTQNIAVSVTPSDAVITYASSDEAKATVSSTGLVTGVAAGTATITATASKTGYANSSCTTTVTVQAAAKGKSRTNPAKIGDVLTITRDYYNGGTFTLELRDLVSGSAAWAMIYAANQFNTPPPAGKEYVLAKFRVHVTSTPAGSPFSIQSYDFDRVTQGGTVYNDFFFVFDPSPELDTDIYPGGEHEGWATFLVNVGDHTVVAYDRGEAWEAWFDLRP